jgi:hypothetical protein
MLYLTSYLETNVAKYMSAIFYYSTMIHMYYVPQTGMPGSNYCIKQKSFNETMKEKNFFPI